MKGREGMVGVCRMECEGVVRSGVMEYEVGIASEWMDVVGGCIKYLEVDGAGVRVDEHVHRVPGVGLELVRHMHHLKGRGGDTERRGTQKGEGVSTIVREGECGCRDT